MKLPKQFCLAAIVLITINFSILAQDQCKPPVALPTATEPNIFSDERLAGVIAHELGHLVAHQGAIDTTRMFREVLGVTSVTDCRDVFDKYNQLIENLNRKPGAFKVQDREKAMSLASLIEFQ